MAERSNAPPSESGPSSASRESNPAALGSPPAALGSLPAALGSLPAALGSLPAALGYRWPAEWEPHEATWLSWPKNAETWPGCLRTVEAVFVRMVEVLLEGERVRINVDDERSEERVRGLLRADGVEPERVDFCRIPTDDAWARDHGPHFLVRDGAAPLAVLDWDFDAWGGKYPPWDRDAAVASRVAEARGLPRFAPGVVLEPGAIDGDGAGSVLTTEACLLNPNRAPDGVPRTREQLEAIFAGWLGAERVIWLGDGIEGDDTDGHVDDVTRFVSPSRIVTAVEPDPADANHAPLADNLRRLRAQRDGRGRAYEIVELPMPARVEASGERLPASHANFYIANRSVLVPTFGGASDERALRILAECLPGREVVGIPSRELVVGLGAVHCLTQQEPRPAHPGAVGGTTG